MTPALGAVLKNPIRKYRDCIPWSPSHTRGHIFTRMVWGKLKNSCGYNSCLTCTERIRPVGINIGPDYGTRKPLPCCDDHFGGFFCLLGQQSAISMAFKKTEKSKHKSFYSMSDLGFCFGKQKIKQNISSHRMPYSL